MVQAWKKAIKWCLCFLADLTGFLADRVTTVGWWNRSKDGSRWIRGVFFEKSEVLHEWPCSTAPKWANVSYWGGRGNSSFFFHHFQVPCRSSGGVVANQYNEIGSDPIRTQVWLAWRAGDRLLTSVQVRNIHKVEAFRKKKNAWNRFWAWKSMVH